MKKITYQSKNYKAETPVRRHVRKNAGDGDRAYSWCEQSLADTRYDLRQGTCSREDLPKDIAEKCDAYKGSFYACEWPK